MIAHDLTVYDKDPYVKENLISMGSYVNLIDRYKIGNNDFLELGIGHSKTVSLLVKTFEHLSVIDAELPLLEKYEKEYEKVNFIHNYFENFDPDNQLYNNIGMGFILEHVKDPEEILKKYSKLLSDNGRIFVSVPNANSLHRIIANKAGLLNDIHEMSETDKRYGHVRFYTYENWVELFQRCGLNVIASHGLFLKPFTTNQIHELNLSQEIYSSLSTVAEDYPSISNSCFFALEKTL